MVEALTIVVAAGVSRGSRWGLLGAGAAVLVLGVPVLAVGRPLMRYIPSTGSASSWALCCCARAELVAKAILRSSGHKAMHDEDEIYAETVADLGGEAER